jgi:U3 small nucleolar RNA-associated protein 10
VAQDTLDEIMTIVSVSTLEHVTSALLARNDEGSQRNGLQIASTSIDAMLDDERQQAASFTPQIIGKAKALIMDIGETEMDTALSALDALRSILSHPQIPEHAALADVTMTIAEISKSSQDGVIVERTMDILRRLCEILGPRLIPMLAALVKTCKSIVIESNVDRRRQENGLNVFTALIRSVPSFMSSYLVDIFGMCIGQASLSESGSMRKMLSAACRYISPNDVLQAISAVHSHGKKGDLYVHLFCLDVVQLSIRSMDKQKTLSYHKQIFRFLVTFFDVRRQCRVSPNTWSLSSEEIEQVESRSVGVFIRLVFRLSEAVFRPLFLRLCDWALVDLADEESEENDSDQDESRAQIRARQVILFKVLNALLQELGELVTQYYGNVLDASIELLGNLADEKVSVETLWQPVVSSVKICASADSSGFWNATRTNKILPVLVAQVRTPVVRESTAMQRLLSDTISQLCSDVSDESCVKRANESLLILTRDVSVDQESVASTNQTRLIALRVLDRLWRTKGCEDSLLTLVPETVPSIAELLQEGEETLQPAVATLVSAIEEILGEGLESYLQ